jgi:sugar/nucleoside kinase (ribokinase family)
VAWRYRISSRRKNHKDAKQETHKDSSTLLSRVIFSRVFVSGILTNLMAPPFDIVGLGCAAVDDLLYVPTYPPADAKVQIRRRERQGGGLTATALVAAARLGSRCAYAGVLGDDDLSLFVRRNFEQEGVDVTWVRQQPDARPIHSIIIVDEGKQTRTIFYDLENVFGAQPDWPDADVIRSAGALFVDHFGTEGMSWAARIARAAGVPVVADFERGEMPGFAELLALVDHVIVSREFAAKLTGETEPAPAARKLWSEDRKAVVVTTGEAGCWYFWNCDPPRHQPAFPVQTVDTTGCGDVFHGAYASALVRGLEVPEVIRFASAAAALKAMRRGGQAGAPTRAAVEAFLASHERAPLPSPPLLGNNLI